LPLPGMDKSVDSATLDEADGATTAHNQVIRKDKKFVGVDAACGGVVFVRIKIDVDACEMMTRIFGEIDTSFGTGRYKESGN
jgi:hypothetical protein